MRPHHTFESEQSAAEQLVSLLVARHALPMTVLPAWIKVHKNWKVTFHFWRCEGAPTKGNKRYGGKGVGLEIDWGECKGDVDEWQMGDGDLADLVMHGWQIAKRWLRGNREVKPSELLRRTVNG